MIYIIICEYFDDITIEACFKNKEDAFKELVRLEAKNLKYHYYKIEEHKLR